MPNWSFSTDWSDDLLPEPPELRTGAQPSALVAEPTLNNATGELISRDRYEVSIMVDGGVKCLVIDIESTAEVPVLAMVPGQVACDGNRSILTTDIFSLSGMIELLQEEVALFPDLLPPPSQGTFPIRWFQNWIDAGRVPRKIIYENLVEDEARVCDDTAVHTGQHLGNMGSHPSVGGRKQLRLKIEYADSTADAPRFMHPREFFSLLFWSETCDPFFSSDPSLRDYEHPLLQKMMRRFDDGTSVITGSGEEVVEITQILNNISNQYDNVDRWLGLRPPLRIYKRIEWEARTTHFLHHENWQNACLARDPVTGNCTSIAPLPSGDLTNLLRNPLVLISATFLRTESKCNLLAGELVFRSGFRPFVSIAGGHLSYQSGDSFIIPRCNAPSCDREPIHIGPTAALSIDGVNYRINAVRGRKRYFHSSNIDTINQDIQENGKGIIYARKRYCTSGTNLYPPTPLKCSDGKDPKAFHVMILANISSIAGSSINAEMIDQHIVLPDIPRSCTAPYCGFGDSNGRALIEMAPGGDPTEDWGVLDLNGLEEAR